MGFRDVLRRLTPGTAWRDNDRSATVTETEMTVNIISTPTQSRTAFLSGGRTSDKASPEDTHENDESPRYDDLLEDTESPTAHLTRGGGKQRRKCRCSRKIACISCGSCFLFLAIVVAIALGLYYRVPLGPLVCPSELYDSADGTCDNFDSPNAGTNSPPLELYDEYSGDGFLDKWDFMTFDDPTHGTVNYVTREDAAASNLTYYDSATGLWYLKADATNKVASGSRGRDSVRIQSKERFRHGLFVFDSYHMPTGCGVWPAFWMYEDPWPEMGEIDIIEGIHKETHNSAALHTTDGCTMERVPTDSFHGRWNIAPSSRPAHNCDVNAGGQGPNQGCSLGFRDDTFGAAWNEEQGGVYATLWDDTGIRIWVFKRDCIPPDLKCNKPEPLTWGMPQAFFRFGDDCTTDHFSELRIVINLTFCGDFAGPFWAWLLGGCLAKDLFCGSHVREEPRAFEEAYWAVKHVQIYQLASVPSSTPPT